MHKWDDIGEVLRSQGKWNWNWLYFLPFIFTFEQGVTIFLGTEEEVGVLGVLPKDCKNFASKKRPWNDCDKLVEMVEKIEPIPDEQKWRREPVDDKGWFKLTNPATNKVLTAHKNDWLSITGTMLKRQIQATLATSKLFMQGKCGRNTETTFDIK